MICASLLLTAFAIGIYLGGLWAHGYWESAAHPLNETVRYRGRVYWIVEHGDFSKAAKTVMRMREAPP